MLIQSTKNISQGPVKLILYGESGTGKTSQVKSLVDNGFKPLVVSAENGLLSLASLKDKDGKQIDVPYFDITRDDANNPIPRGRARVQRVQDLYAWLLNPETQKSYDTLVFDTLTEVANSMIEQNIEEKKIAKSDLRQAWGDYAFQLMKLVYAFRDIPHYNTIFICQEDLDKDENSGKRFFGPSIPGNAAHKPLRAALDFVYRMFIGEGGKRLFQTGATESVYAKHRGTPLDNIILADLGSLMRKIKNENGTGIASNPTDQKDSKEVAK